MDSIIITQKMLDAAKDISNRFTINRTRFSKEDKIIGVLGELVFSKWIYGEYESHLETILTTKGQCDFEGGVEIKCSKFPFNNNLNLFVREDYAKKRSPNHYVQLIIDTDKDRDIKAGDKVYICGYCSSEELHSNHKNKMTYTPDGSFNSWVKPIRELHKMDDFRSKHLMVLLGV